MNKIRPNMAAEYEVWAAICGCMHKLGCADIGALIDNTSGRVKVYGTVSPDSCAPKEIHRWREYEVSTGALVMPANEARQYINEIGGIGCETSIQLRSCDGKYIEHISGLEFDNIQRSGISAQGVGAQDSVQLYTMPFVWRESTEIFEASVKFVDAGSNDIESTVVSVVYCDCKSCCSCGPDCRTIYRIKADGTLEVSNDGGETWEALSACLPSAPIKLICLNGALYSVHYNGDIYYSLSAHSEINFRKVKRNFGRIIDATDNGGVIYVLHEDGTISGTVDGETLEKFYTVESEGLIVIDANGQYVVVAGDDGRIILSENSGYSWSEYEFFYEKHGDTDIVAVSISVDGSCFSLTVAVNDNSLYKSSNLETWRQISPPISMSKKEAPAFLETFLEGYIIWYGRVINDEMHVFRYTSGCCSDSEEQTSPISTNPCELIDGCPWVCIDENCDPYALTVVPYPDVPDTDCILIACYDPKECELILVDCNASGCNDCGEKMLWGFPATCEENDDCIPNTRPSQYEDSCDIGATICYPAGHRTGIIGCDTDCCVPENAVELSETFEGIDDGSVVWGYEDDDFIYFYSCDICTTIEEYEVVAMTTADECLYLFENVNYPIWTEVETCQLDCVDIPEDIVFEGCVIGDTLYIHACEFSSEYNCLCEETIIELIENGHEFILPPIASYEMCELVTAVGDPDCDECSSDCKAEFTPVKVSAMAVCPDDINQAIIIGSEALASQNI